MPFAPLNGMRVVDLTTSFAGPYCTQLLAALGADVVKIEPLGGDAARLWGPPFWGDSAAIFLAANAGKRSLAIDLGRGAGIVARLAERADVLVQSLRPGHAEEIGLGADVLLERNPRLVYCSIGSYGRGGPKSALPGYDPLMQAAAGLISVTGEPGRTPVRLGISAIDQGTAMWAAIAVQSALLEREKTGRGQEVDVALYETALSFMSYHLIGYLGSGKVPQPLGTAFPSVAPYQIFDASDGTLIIAAATDRQFRSLAEIVGAADLADERRFASNPDRVANRDALAEALSARLRTATRAHWLGLLAAAGVPAAPVQNVAEVAVDEQTLATGMLQQVGEFTLVAPPLAGGGERPVYASTPPQPGADSRAVLLEAGLSTEEIDRLEADEIVRSVAGSG